MMEISDMHIDTLRYDELCRAWNGADVQFMERPCPATAEQVVKTNDALLGYERRYLSKLYGMVLKPENCQHLVKTIRDLTLVEFARPGLDEEERIALFRATHKIEKPRAIVSAMNLRKTAVSEARDYLPLSLV